MGVTGAEIIMAEVVAVEEEVVMGSIIFQGMNGTNSRDNLLKTA